MLMRLLILGLLFIGCSTKYEAKRPSIDGEWILVETTNEILSDEFGLKFEDDTLYLIADRGLIQEGKFIIRGDTIIVKEFGNRINKRRRIKQLTTDSLILVGDTKYYSRRLEFADNLKLDSIKVIADGCLGECPQFNLKLTADGEVNFKPIANCKTTQEMTFRIEKEQMNQIDSLFKWTYIHRLDTNSIHVSDDGWLLDISISYNNGRHIRIKTTYYDIPYRLKRILGFLIKDVEKRELI
jgi:hypothetical protein